MEDSDTPTDGQETTPTPILEEHWGLGSETPDRPKAVAAALPPDGRRLLRLASAAGGALLGALASPAPSLAAVQLAVRIGYVVGDLSLTPAGRAEQIAHVAMLLDVTLEDLEHAFTIVTLELLRPLAGDPVEDTEDLQELGAMVGRALEGWRS